MTLYADLQQKIQEADAGQATEILQDIWEQGVDLDRLTACLIEPACASLQLRFDTPHAMICLDSLIQLLDQILPEDRLYFVRWFVQYLCGLPKLFLDFKDIERMGRLEIQPAKKGYARSLIEHKVNNGFYYALRFIEEEGLEDYLHQCLEIATHEVDFLGHVLIYTHTLGRLCRVVEPRQTKTLIFQLTEFLARRAKIEAEELKKEGRELDSLIPLALERINILGHNAIFAHKISQVVDHLEGRYVEHLSSQLVRNVENASDQFSEDDLQEMLGGVRDETQESLAALRRSLARGDVRQSICYGCFYLENQGLTADLFSTLAKSLAAKDPSQPHYIIFPQAVFDLAGIVGEPHAEVAMARVIRMIAGLD